jgi:hypothetical protein
MVEGTLNRTTPRPGTAAHPSPAAAQLCVGCGSPRGIISRAARGSRMVGPLAAWSQAPRHQRGSGRAPPARRAARRLSRGPAPKRRSGASATRRRAKRLWPAERKNPVQGKALTVLAPQLARAVSDRRTRATVCDRPKFLNGEGSGAGEPHASLDAQGRRLASGALLSSRRQRTRRRTEALGP